MDDQGISQLVEISQKVSEFRETSIGSFTVIIINQKKLKLKYKIPKRL